MISINRRTQESHQKDSGQEGTGRLSESNRDFHRWEHRTSSMDDCPIDAGLVSPAMDARRGSRGLMLMQRVLPMPAPTEYINPEGSRVGRSLLQRYLLCLTLPDADTRRITERRLAPHLQT